VGELFFSLQKVHLHVYCESLEIALAEYRLGITAF